MPNFDPTKELSGHDAIILIKDIIENHCVDIDCLHNRERMEQRGYSDQDVIHVLEMGVVVGTEFDNERRNWKYRIKGEDIDGDEGIVITAIVSSYKLVIITVF
jgi:hypothetical protein